MKKFNINYTVKVKLTEFGKNVLTQQHAGESSYTLPEEDENGYSQFRMKTLMNEFGAYLGPDQQEIPFELDILIDEIDLKA